MNSLDSVQVSSPSYHSSGGLVFCSSLTGFCRLHVAALPGFGVGPLAPSGPHCCLLWAPTSCCKCAGWKGPPFSTDSMCLCSVSSTQGRKKNLLLPLSVFIGLVLKQCCLTVFSETSSHFQFHWGSE